MNQHVEIFGTVHDSLYGLKIRDVALGEVLFDLRLGVSGSAQGDVDGIIDRVFISH